MNTQKKIKSVLYIKALILSTSLSVWGVDAPAITDCDVLSLRAGMFVGTLEEDEDNENWTPYDTITPGGAGVNALGQILDAAGNVQLDDTNNPRLAPRTSAALAIQQGMSYINRAVAAPAQLIIDPEHPIVGGRAQAVRLTRDLIEAGRPFHGFADAEANLGRYVCHYTLNRTIPAVGTLLETNYVWNLFLVNTAIDADPAIVEAERIRALPLHERITYAQECQAAAHQARLDAVAQYDIASDALLSAMHYQNIVNDPVSARTAFSNARRQLAIAQAALVEENRLLNVARTIRDDLVNRVTAAGANVIQNEIDARDAAEISFIQAENAATGAQNIVTALVELEADCRAEFNRRAS